MGYAPTTNLPRVKIAEIEDENEKLKAILVAVNLSPDETKNALYHSFGALALEKLSDGKLTWSEARRTGVVVFIPWLECGGLAEVRQNHLQEIIFVYAVF